MPTDLQQNSAEIRHRLRDRLVAHMVLNTTLATIEKKASLICLKIPSEYKTKRDALEAAFDAVSDDDLPNVAIAYLKWMGIKGEERNSIQDLVWARENHPEIPKRYRRELARALLGPLYRDFVEFIKLLENLWMLDANPYASFFDKPAHVSLRAKIEKHFCQNDDWDTETLFHELGAFSASDRRFALLLEGLASSDVLQDTEAQKTFVTIVNNSLQGCGVGLLQVSTQHGYPVFRLSNLIGGVLRTPKNLIFGSQQKPDLRLKNSVDNDVEIVTHADEVLVYDRPISDGGLIWSELQEWWATRECITDHKKAKNTLYQRLKNALPDRSPPQQYLARGYYLRFGGDIPRLPALLPEVWLHWDPKTVKERGVDALFRFRMDFLMLLPNRVRVVIEVDGKQHYADDEGNAQPSKYGEMARADRDLRLAGYEVFRFGGAELNNEDSAIALAGDFFESLFDRYRITYSTATSR